jgi:glycerophosphoryl diester phosphodiesterase
MLERAEALRAEAIHPARTLVNAELVREIHRAGLRVNVFTVDDPDDQRRLLDWGVDGIFTNVPAQLRKILDAR